MFSPIEVESLTAIKLELWQKRIMEMFQEMKNRIADIANICAEIEQRKELQSKWIVIRDTRRKSQVTDNKPRHLIKKII